MPHGKTIISSQTIRRQQSKSPDITLKRCSTCYYSSVMTDSLASIHRVSLMPHELSKRCYNLLQLSRKTNFYFFLETVHCTRNENTKRKTSRQASAHAQAGVMIEGAFASFAPLNKPEATLWNIEARWSMECKSCRSIAKEKKIKEIVSFFIKGLPMPLLIIKTSFLYPLSGR